MFPSLVSFIFFPYLVAPRFSSMLLIGECLARHLFAAFLITHTDRELRHAASRGSLLRGSLLAQLAVIDLFAGETIAASGHSLTLVAVPSVLVPALGKGQAPAAAVSILYASGICSTVDAKAAEFTLWKESACDIHTFLIATVWSDARQFQTAALGIGLALSVRLLAAVTLFLAALIAVVRLDTIIALTARAITATLSDSFL
jgi:hypothetical protein